MNKGIILKGYSSFYYVQYQEQIFECSLRGKHRIKETKFLPGDYVTFTPLDENKGVIESLIPRNNQLTRPPIANVDQVIIVNAIKDPEPDLWLIDRLTILALWNDIEPIICLNKVDLLQETNLIQDIYHNTDFKLINASAKTSIGVYELQDVLKGKISVFAGPSGVGKSSLLNAVQKNLGLKTGEVSHKSRRGKHTTRHVELLELESGGLVADTPGFSTLELPREIKREELSFLFPDFNKPRIGCKFNTCLHKGEPQCGVRDQVEKGGVSSSRYEHYLTFLEEVIKQERSY